MKCIKCNHIIPDDSEFCPFCGIPVEKAFTCSKCGKELAEESVFCPFCGNKLPSLERDNKVKCESEEKNIVKTTIRKSSKKLFPKIALALLAIAIIFGGFFGLNAFFAKKHLAAEEYSKAASCFDRIIVADKVFPGEYEYAKAGQSFEQGDMNSFAFYSKLNYLSRNYSNVIPKAKIDKLTKSLYSTAVKWYDAGNYGSKATDKETAFQYFDAVKPYKESTKYLALLNARANNYILSIGSKMNITTENVVKLIDFQDAKEVLVSNDTIALDFLTGSWKSPDGNYYFKVEDDDNDGASTISYNIPYFDMDDSYLGIIDGHVILYSDDLSNAEIAYSQGKYNLLFDVSVLSAQQITVYSYKSDAKYALFRE